MGTRMSTKSNYCEDATNFHVENKTSIHDSIYECFFQIKKTNNEIHDMKKVSPKDKKIYRNTWKVSTLPRLRVNH